MLQFDRDDGFSSSAATIMNQTVINGAAPFLPEEIMINILKRLPVKSLIRFQCVCERWKNLLQLPSFIADHLRHSRHRNPSLLFFDTFRPDPLQIHLLDCEMQVRDVHKPPPLGSFQSCCVSVIGSSNGLLCVQTRECGFSLSPSLLLWNPATRDIREVPRYRVYKCVLGFGFSSFVDDYKIVAIDRKICRAGVYSLSRDSWKEIELGNILEHVTIYRETVVSSNGAIFWPGLKPGEDNRKEGVIISFDIATEILTLIPCPSDHRDSYSSFNLVLYKDKLAALVSGIGASRTIDLWVMEENIGSSENRWSWTQKFIGISCPWTLYFGAIWRDEIVIPGTETQGKVQKSSGLSLFSLITNEFKVLAIPKPDYCNFLNYVESLVPVANIKKIEGT
ncbi:F-box/kelch-repeat protein At3g06240-like [Neltuma alba]|uniref:F-box/kelch-repeat protein At3g06240-like n=1 Tax=Neltuma alba TaxID=207710 RepID=UPI0010A44D24|nr:F-box/kelch-repeat protein At3g06240-like [Prosopis alba]